MKKYLILVAVLVLIILGGFVYFNNSSNEAIQKSETASSTSIVNDNRVPLSSVQPDDSEVVTSPLEDEKASGVIKNVYTKDGKNYLDIDYIILNPNFMPGGQSGPAYTNDNPKIRTFEISKDVKIFASGPTPSQTLTLKQFLAFFVPTGMVNGKLQYNNYQYANPWDIEVTNGVVTKITEHYIS